MILIEDAMKKLGVGVTELAKRLNVNRMTVYYYIRQGEKNRIRETGKNHRISKTVIR